MGQTNLRVVENTSMDKNKALEAALSQIDRAFGKGSVMKLGPEPGRSKSKRFRPARSASISRWALAACRAAA